MKEVLEHAILHVVNGRENDFETALAHAMPLIRQSPGCIDAYIQRGIENRSKYVLLVRWETLEAHTEGFRNSEDFTMWRELLWDFYDPKPEPEHFVAIGR